jgi:predicted MPP superfamily phosphohydrolase
MESWAFYWLAWAGVILWPALLLFALWRGLKKGEGPGAIGWALVALVTVIWGLGIRAFLWEPETLDVRRVETVSRGWSGPPLKIGIISDTHMDAPHMSLARLDGIVRQMNAERPDIVVLLGDYAGGHTSLAQSSEGRKKSIATSLSQLGKLQAPLGVWAVLGNHDWWYDGPTIERGLEAAGIPVLENERVLVNREGGAFWVAGLADFDSLRTRPSFSDTLSDIPDGAPVLALAHWPDVFAAAPDRVALTLAGHTHCGQVNLPFAGRLMHASEGSARWPCGLYEERGRKLYVTGGLGTSILPVRFLQPPEIAILTLRAG